MVGLADDLPSLEKRTELLAASIRDINANKLRLASRVLDEVVAKITPEEAGADLFAVLVAGDLVFEMAHEAPRPERSTGQMVRGSDIDLVVILDDSAPAALEQRLDETIYQQKYRYLINPSLREEIDYTIKRLALVREQVAFEHVPRHGVVQDRRRGDAAVRQPEASSTPPRAFWRSGTSLGSWRR